MAGCQKRPFRTQWIDLDSEAPPAGFEPATRRPEDVGRPLVRTRSGRLKPPDLVFRAEQTRADPDELLPQLLPNVMSGANVSADHAQVWLGMSDDRLETCPRPPFQAGQSFARQLDTSPGPDLRDTGQGLPNSSTPRRRASSEISCAHG